MKSKLLLGVTDYLSASYSQDNKSNLEHKQALNTFILNQEQLRKENEIKLTVELLNNPYNPIGWIPGLRSVVNAGADLNYSRTHNTAFTPYTADTALSTAGDAITLGFGLGPLNNYAGSYVGTVAGGLLNYRPVIRGFDMWKFNSKDYIKKLGPTMGLKKSPFKKWAISKGLDLVDKAGLPIVFKDSWKYFDLLDIHKPDVLYRYLKIEK